MEGPIPAFTLERTQSLSHADLRRLLPRVLGDTVVGLVDGFTASWTDGRRLNLVLAAETERRLGSLRIISTTLHFHFLDWTAAQREAFMLRYERALQQGGG